MTLFLRNIAESTTEHVGNAGFLDVLPLTIRDSPGPNRNYESQPSSKAYTGPASFTPGVGSVGPLHSNPYPNTASPGEERECAAGNEPYHATGALVGNPTTSVGVKTEKTTRGERLKRHGSRVPNLAAGLIGIVVIVAICWVVFGGPIPFSGSGFTLEAVYTSQTELHLDSPVRIAGVNVGKVTGIKHIGGDSAATLVTMSIDHDGLPIHADATSAIRPRLFLEGNYYINLQPGTPEAPALSSGATLSSPHNSGPVQLDRVLSALNGNARRNLQTLLQDSATRSTSAQRPPRTRPRIPASAGSPPDSR